MSEIKDNLSDLLFSATGEKVKTWETLPKAGSDRQYYRMKTDTQSYIATYNPDNKENISFLSFTIHFYSKDIPVPNLLAIDEIKGIYVQEDLGNTCLLDVLNEEGYTEKTFALYKQTLEKLVQLQIDGDEGLDYSVCFSGKKFDYDAMMADLYYFKYYFLYTLKIVYDDQQLVKDFKILTKWLESAPLQYFMYRDCQARNIMVKEDKIYFIDYQGGKKGPLQYDVASLLWQAKAALPVDWKEKLLDFYYEQTNKKLGGDVKKEIFLEHYNGFVLLRILQVLGAYGLRGLFERRSHFLESIPFALENLKWWLQNCTLPIEIPELSRVMHEITTNEIIKNFKIKKAGPNDKLVVRVCSFSYKSGIPKDESENGGGFVFDCRAIYNPGRYEEYKKLTGRDKPVIDFLLTKSTMPSFLENVYGLVDVAVENYLEREFESLVVCFGCTGGQHRSVYAADTLAKHLKEKYGVNVELKHCVQDAKNWIN